MHWGSGSLDGGDLVVWECDGEEGEMEDFISKCGGPSTLEDTMKKLHCFTIDDDMVISKSHDKNEEF